jgi:hypothetical protein
MAYKLDSINADTQYYATIANDPTAPAGEKAAARARLTELDAAAAQAARTDPAAAYRGTNTNQGIVDQVRQFGGTGGASSADTTSLINDMYNQYIANQVAQAQAAYKKGESSLANMDRQIDQQYYDARNAAAANANQAQAAFNEYAAASGLNSGVGGQAMLSRQNALQGAMTQYNVAEAQAHADIQTQKEQLRAEMESAIAQAQATGNYQRLAALVDNAKYLQQMEMQLEQQAFERQQYENSQAQYQTQTLADAGWNMISAGIMPTAEQLAAMNTTPEQASAYIAQIQLANAAKAKGGGGGSGGKAKPEDDPVYLTAAMMASNNPYGAVEYLAGNMDDENTMLKYIYDLELGDAYMQYVNDQYAYQYAHSGNVNYYGIPYDKTNYNV